MNRNRQRATAVFVLLVAIGVAGRWMVARGVAGLPWNATPLAAIGLLAGFYFQRRIVALAVPLAAMVVSNLLLPQYDSWLMTLVVYASFMAGPVAGRWLRSGATGVLPLAAKATVCVLAPSLLFFLTTNAAQWIVDGMHQHSMYGRDLAGLLSCYAAGLPFYRWMLWGDIVFTATLFGAYAAAVAIRAALVAPRSRAKILAIPCATTNAHPRPTTSR